MTNIDTPIKELNNKFNKFLEAYCNAYNSLDYDQLSLEELKQYVDEEIDYSLEEWLSEDELSEIVEVYREVVNDWD